jgi:aconitate decarboxylase
VIHDPAITAKGSKFRHLVRVEVHLKDGTKMERTVEYARGSEKKFASAAEIVEKFEKLATHVLPRQQVEQLRDAMLKLETLKDAGQIARLMEKR